MISLRVAWGSPVSWAPGPLGPGDVSPGARALRSRTKHTITKPYYLPHLTPLANLSRSDLLKLTDADFKNILNGKLPLPKLQEIRDELEDTAGDEADSHVAALEPPSGAGQGAKPAAALALPTIKYSVEELQLTQCGIAGAPSMTVHFDRFTHQSGNRRALFECSLHNKCRLDCSIKDFSSREQFVAFLFAWDLQGLEVDDEIGAKSRPY